MAKKIKIEEPGDNAPQSIPSDPSNEINSLLSGYSDRIVIDEPAAQDFTKKKRGRKPKGEQDQPTGQDPNNLVETPMLSGALLIMLIDLALPNLVCFANNKLDKKGKKIQAGALMMTEEQRKELEPVADQVAKEMSLKANPLVLLIVSMLGIYGINFMMLKNE
jgi:hypothetical protein